MNPLTVHSRWLASSRNGITLIEVLISMGVLVIGLLGVASVFPVGSYYIDQGDQFDRSQAVRSAAMNEISAREMLKTDYWRIKDGSNANQVLKANMGNVLPHAYAIDPLGLLQGASNGFPNDPNFAPNPDRIRRISFADAYSAVLKRNQLVASGATDYSSLFKLSIDLGTADLIFTSRDDIAFSVPSQGDLPAIQLFETDVNDPLIALRRAWNGNYSWLVTVGPVYRTNLSSGGTEILTGEPTLAHDVSVVVFKGRRHLYTSDPSAAEPIDERELQVDRASAGIGGGELRVRPLTGTNLDLTNIVQGEWVLVSGWDPAYGTGADRRLFMKWYKIISIEDEAGIDSTGTRILSLQGPDWPWDSNSSTRNPTNFDVRVGVFNGAVAVTTISRPLESSNQWSIE